MSISEVSLSHDAFFTGEFMKYSSMLNSNLVRRHCTMYNGTITVDDIHITYIFADILYLVIIHIIKSRIK